MDRYWVSGSGDSVVNKYVLKIEYSAGDPITGAIGMRQSILNEMRFRDFDAFFLELTASERTDPTEWNRVYASWNEMRGAQLQNVISITKVMVSAYISLWLGVAGPAGEVIDAVLELPQTASDIARASTEAFEFLSLLPGKALAVFDDTQGEYLDNLTPPGGGGGGGILPPDEHDSEEPDNPPGLGPATLFAKLDLPNFSAILKGDVVKVRLGNNAYASKGFVLRKDMPVKMHTRGDGSKMAFVGKAQQVTSAADAHVRTIDRLANELAEHGKFLNDLPSVPARNYIYIGKNRSVRTMVADGLTGNRYASCSRKRPDIVAVWKDDNGNFGVDMFEVASGDQQTGVLTEALDQVMQTLPGGVTQGRRLSFDRDP